MIKQEIRDKFDIPQHAVLFALIYRAAVELYGRQGAQRADNGTKVYGYQRGMRMAQRAVKDKQPLNMRRSTKVFCTKATDRILHHKRLFVPHRPFAQRYVHRYSGQSRP